MQVKNWKDVKEEIQEATQEIWLEEPIELKKLRLGIVDNEAGTYGQYFTTWVMVDGDLRSLAKLLVGGLAKATKLESLSLNQLKDLVGVFLPVGTPLFLGYCGLKSVERFTEEIRAVLPTIETRDQFRELFSTFSLYLIRMTVWLENFFPWELGYLFPQRDKKSAEELLSLIDES